MLPADFEEVSSLLKEPRRLVDRDNWLVCFFGAVLRESALEECNVGALKKEGEGVLLEARTDCDEAGIDDSRDEPREVERIEIGREALGDGARIDEGCEALREEARNTGILPLVVGAVVDWFADASGCFLFRR